MRYRVEVFRLRSLRLTNFRGFESLDIAFDPQLTVLVGVNGSGKSSVLAAVVQGSRPIFGDRTLSVLDVRASAHQALVEIEFEDPDGGNPRWSVVSRHGAAELDGPHAHWLAGRRLILHYGTSRAAKDRTPGSTAGEAWQPMHAHEEWFDAGASYERFFIWFREMEDLENEALRDGQRAPSQLAAVRRAVEKALDVANLRVRRRFEPFSHSPILTVDKDGVTLPFDALSEGERSLVALVADIARRLSLKSPEQGLDLDAVVLIDEIELHLHPSLQRDILGRLRGVFPNVQWITTTHSPIVASELEARHLRVLEDFQLRDVGHGRGREIDAILRDVFDTPARPAAIEQRFETLVEADLVYYRAILERIAS